MEKNKKWRVAFQHWVKDYQWLLFVIYSILIIILAYVGLYLQEVKFKEPVSILGRMFQVLTILKGGQGPIKNFAPFPLEIARVLAFFAGLFVALKTFGILLAKQWLLLRLKFLRNHSVIFGLNEMSFQLAKTLTDNGYLVLVVDSSPTDKWLIKLQNQDILFLEDDPTDSFVYQKTGVQFAKYVFAFMEEEGKNSELAVQVKEFLNQTKKANPLADVFIHIPDPDLWNSLRGEEMEWVGKKFYDIHYFNLFDLTAKNILQAAKLEKEILMIGFNSLSENILLNLSRELFFARKKQTEKFKVVILDFNIEHKLEWLLQKYPAIGEVCTLVHKDIASDALSLPSPREMKQLLEGCHFSSIFICVGNDNLTIAWALSIQKLIKNLTVPILLSMNQSSGLSKLLNDETSNYSSAKYIQTFDTVKMACNISILENSILETLARQIHQEYVAKQKDKGVTELDNPSIVPWNQLPLTLQDSNRNQAKHIMEKIELIGCDISILMDWRDPLFEFEAKELENLSRTEHDRWVEDRIKLGWKQGPKDVANKITPFLIPYEELTEEIKDLDRDTIRNIPLLLAKTGFSIYRKDEPC
jgi:voltage-gated potassium channel Kch